MTGSSTLLIAFAVIAASLLGGCSDKIIGVVGSDAEARVHTVKPVSRQMPIKPADLPVASSRDVKQRLASLAVDDAKLSDVRGGFDAGSGVTLNFAFQQATFVNNNLTENVVVPTLTISPGQTGGVAAGGGVAAPTSSITGLSAFGIPGALSTSSGGSINSATVVTDNAVQTQVSVSNSTLQALVNSGLATVVGGGTGNGGVSSTITNTGNNQLIQQMTTIDIGVSGLSKLMQQGVASSVMNRLTGPTLR
ncbi:MAG: hypothetical protein WB611_31685 [Stellaceae bacterium]